MKALFVTLILYSVASAKVKPSINYQDAVFLERHAESVRVNCFGTQYGSSMSTCHDAQVLVYTVKMGGAVYTLTPYATPLHHESLWGQPAGEVKVWNDGKHVHVRTGAKESQYDIIGESAQDARE